MNEEQKQSMKKGLRLEVFAPAYIVVAAAALIGLLNSDLLTSAMGKFCEWALDSFGWLIQRAVVHAARRQYKNALLCALPMVAVLVFARLWGGLLPFSYFIWVLFS